MLRASTGPRGGAAAAAGAAAGDTLSLDPLELEELRASLARASALHGAERWAEESAVLREVGRRLGAALASAAAGDHRGGDPRHLALWARDQALMALPWELAAPPNGDPATFLFTPGHAVLTRGEKGLRASSGDPQRPLMVSLLREEALHFGLSDLTDSVAALAAAIESGIAGAGRAGSTLFLGTLGTPPAAGTPPPGGRPIRLLHLLGHGYETAGIDARFEYGMHCASLRDTLPEDCFGEAPAERIAQELARHGRVDVLLLDACYTGGGFLWDGERWRDPLCTFAGRLGASVVVSFFDAVRTAQARVFFLHFYERLFAGDSPLAAAVAARDALFRAEVGSPLHSCVWWKVRIATGLSAAAAAGVGEPAHS